MIINLSKKRTERSSMARALRPLRAYGFEDAELNDLAAGTRDLYEDDPRLAALIRDAVEIGKI